MDFFDDVETNIIWKLIILVMTFDLLLLIRQLTRYLCKFPDFIQQVLFSLSLQQQAI